MYCIERFSNWGMKKLRALQLGDFVVLKCCVFLFGLLGGSYFARSLKKFRPLLWAAAVASYAFLIWRMVIKDER